MTINKNNIRIEYDPISHRFEVVLDQFAPERKQVCHYRTAFLADAREKARAMADEQGVPIVEVWDIFTLEIPAGRRAGRPLIGDSPRKQRQLTLTDSEYEALKVAGEGNASAGVSRLIDQWRDRS